ncbi:YqiA/YcfP family alpha/beta fold hydrolase [Saccharospirillum sp. MSK14-1]|uniref:YqiA/YcfP family alpha/beta fold hydrolase n=1 Tax=Saccharospirillum sp. MSK14-1 TaxID=1897632 RepID=UPI001304B1D5|nr:YqiA/YcfP family alpha/beta fold hydrolase [Saccharospirillum sp. MSK14-1]
MSTTLIYTNGFNSAVDIDGELPSDKARYFRDQAVASGWQFQAHNAFYYRVPEMHEALAGLVRKLNEASGRPLLMGSSMGGLLALLALAEGDRFDAQAVLINPLLVHESGLLEDSLGQSLTNYVTGTRHWVDPAVGTELVTWLERVPSLLAGFGDRVTVLLDQGDEVLTSAATAELCEPWCELHEYPGGSHRFEHWPEAWAAIADH